MFSQVRREAIGRDDAGMMLEGDILQQESE